MHEIYNFFTKEIKYFFDIKKLNENYIKILKIISPVIPHIASECLYELDIKNKISWPIADKKYLLKNEINVVVQINGKKRGLINMDNELEERNIEPNQK